MAKLRLGLGFILESRLPLPELKEFTFIRQPETYLLDYYRLNRVDVLEPTIDGLHTLRVKKEPSNIVARSPISH